MEFAKLFELIVQHLDQQLRFTRFPGLCIFSAFRGRWKLRSASITQPRCHDGQRHLSWLMFTL
jgi:hypothetical protein